METHQLRTFVTVAREGSITRASTQLHLSQPAVSAHIKAIEDTLGVTLFERTSQGMTITGDGKQLLTKAKHTLVAHQELLEEASRIKGCTTGKLRLGAGSSASTNLLSNLLTELSERCPQVEVTLEHGTSLDILNSIREGNLDAGFYNEAEEAAADLTVIEVSQFAIYLAAPPGLVPTTRPLDWQALAELPWICPASSTCCGQVAESLFKQHQIRPKRTISMDREKVTRTLISGGIGIGFLHTKTAKEAQRRGEVELVCQARDSVRVLFAHLASRAADPVLSTASAIISAATVQ